MRAWAQAVLVLTPALAAQSNWEAVIREGRAQFESGRFATAEATFRGALRSSTSVAADAGQVVVEHHLAEVLLVMGRQDEAVEWLGRAIQGFARLGGQYDGHRVRALSSLSIAETHVGRFEHANLAARDALELLRRLDRAEVPVIESAGAVAWGYALRRDLSRAIQTYEALIQVLEARGQDVPVVVTRGMAQTYALRGRYADAAGVLRRALSKSGGEVELESMLRTTLGSVLVKAGKLTEAEKELNDALSLMTRRSRPEPIALANVHAEVGRLRLKQARYGEAAEQYEAAFSLYGLPFEHPGVLTRYEEYAQGLQKLGRKQEASRLTENVRNAWRARDAAHSARHKIDVRALRETP